MASSTPQEELQRAKAKIREYQEALGLEKGPDHDSVRKALEKHYSPEITWYGVEPFNVLTGIPCFDFRSLKNLMDLD